MSKMGTISCFIFFIIISSVHLISQIESQSRSRSSTTGATQVSTTTTEQSLADYLFDWDVDDFAYYDDCLTDDTNCIGVPANCIDLQNCVAFVRIRRPIITEEPNPLDPFSEDYKFSLFIRLSPEDYAADVEYWISIGLNKFAPVMGDTFATTCYFSDFQGGKIDSFVHWWNHPTDRFTQIEPFKVLDNKSSAVVSDFASFRDETIHDDFILRCGFYLKKSFIVPIDYGQWPELQARYDKANDPFDRLSFDLAHDGLHLILAWGTITVPPQTSNPLPFNPTFNQHGRNFFGRMTTDKLRLRLPICGHFFTCIGKGEDGCGLRFEDCAIYARITDDSVAVENSTTGDLDIHECGLTIELESRVQTGFIAIVFSETKNLQDSKVPNFLKKTLMLACEAPETKAKIYRLDNCMITTASNNAQIEKETKWSCVNKIEPGKATQVKIGFIGTKFFKKDIQHWVDKFVQDSILSIRSIIKATFPTFNFGSTTNPVCDNPKIVGPLPSLSLSSSSTGEKPAVQLICAFQLQPNDDVLVDYDLRDTKYYMHIFSGNETNYGNIPGQIELTSSESTYFRTRQKMSAFEINADFEVVPEDMSLEDARKASHPIRSGGESGDPAFTDDDDDDDFEFSNRSGSNSWKFTTSTKILWKILLALLLLHLFY